MTSHVINLYEKKCIEINLLMVSVKGEQVRKSTLKRFTALRRKRIEVIAVCSDVFKFSIAKVSVL